MVPWRRIKCLTMPPLKIMLVWATNVIIYVRYTSCVTNRQESPAFAEFLQVRYPPKMLICSLAMKMR